MYLIIQIPCFNEAETLPLVVAELPRSLPGITRLEYQIIDDGSQDNTVEVAQQLGIHHIVHHARNQGLAAAFQSGVNHALMLGADIIVNTDGDNQYPGGRIGDLIKPILTGQADMVIGDRQTHAIAHFSRVKRWLQKFGSWVVRQASGTDIPDATSGFRAFSQEAALRLIVLTRYTYTLETIIQAAKKGLVIAHLPIEVNDPTRRSRLISSTGSYIKRSAATILRLYTLYEPLRSFSYFAIPFLLIGAGLISRFLLLYVSGSPSANRYLQSVTIGGTLFTVGILIFLFGVLADIGSTQRALIEEVLYRQRKQEVEQARLRREGAGSDAAQPETVPQSETVSQSET